MVRMGDGSPQIWYNIVEEMEKKLKDLEFKGDDILLDWKKMARRRRIDREIFEKYGYFKDIILHPRFQVAKQYLEDHANFDVMIGEPLMPWSTAIIVLFMMQRRVSNSILLLTAAFIFNANPLYVSLIVFAMWLFGGGGSKPKQYNAKPKYTKSSKPSAENATADSLAGLAEVKFDHVLIGSDISTMYAAALLAKCGHRCCVLQPKTCSPLVVAPEGAPCPVPLYSTVVSKVERYQSLINAISIAKQSPPSFEPLGQKHDGYTSTVIKLVSGKKGDGKASSGSSSRVMFLRAGELSFLYDVCSSFHLDKTSVTKAFQGIQAAASGITSFLTSRIIRKEDWKNSALAKSEDTKSFSDLSNSSITQTLEKLGFGQPRFQHAMAAVSSGVGLGESLEGNAATGYGLSLILSAVETGRFVMKGGISSVMKSFRETIISSGGIVVKDVDVNGLELIDEKEGESGTESKYKAAGVSINTDSKGKELVVSAEKSVISGVGLLTTALSMLPADALSQESREPLLSLTEAKPKVKCVFWLKGDKTSLGLPNTEYYELSCQSDEMSLSQSEVQTAVNSNSYTKIWSPSATDSSWQNSAISAVVVEMELDDSFVQLEAVKQFGGGEEEDEQHKGPQLYSQPKLPETSPNHPDFGKVLGRRVQLSASRKEDLLRRAEGKLLEVYPRCANKVEFKHCELPFLGGNHISNNTEKYKSLINAATAVKGFYITGADVSTSGFMGDLQAGWITASAVLGYDITDLTNAKNVVQDLLRM